jgi:aminopeptidase N
MKLAIRICALTLAVQAFAQQTSGDPEYRRLREAQLAESYAVENVELRRDVGTIRLKSGTVSFAPAVLGRVTIGVFLGEGEFTLTPAVFYERDYMKSLTGQDTAQETFDRALLFFTDGSYEAIKGSGRVGPVPAAAAEYLKDARQRLRRATFENVEAQILADLYNPRQAGFFSAYMHGRRYPELRFFVKPRGAVPDAGPEEVAVEHATQGNDTEGHWYLGHFEEEYKNGQAKTSEEKRIVAAESYRIETQIAGNERLTAKTEVRFRALRDGDRVISLGLTPSLRVSAVRAGAVAVPFIQEDLKDDGAFYVVLPEPLAKDRSYELTVEYAGDKVVHNAGGGNFSVGARESWYPSVNAFRDQAKYELTFKVPRQFTLVSVGKMVKESREGDFTVSQWVSETPLAVAGFNYGQFRKREVKFDAFPYIVEGFANSGLPDYLRKAEDEIGGASPTRLLERTLAETQLSLRLFERWFGRPPYGRIAVTQQPEFSFGQSWPGLVYLPLSAFLDSTQRWQLMGDPRNIADFIQELTPHEVAHQWWGHMVGWSSIRDQWLSEGFADFSAGLYLQATQPRPDKYLKFLEAARDTILEKNRFGRAPNDAGPLYMGARLSTAKNPNAYGQLVYPKGGYVLHMLRSLMWDAQKGDEPFIAMMRDFVQTHLHKSASTESFQASVEKHMTPAMNLGGNGKMDWFFAQWVYGTDVPQYKFDYTLTPEEGGKVRLKATLSQSGVGERFIGAVPLYGDFDGRQLRLGTIRVVGNATGNVEVSLPQKPRRVAINVNFDVLARK